MNEKLIRPQFDQMDTTEKQVLMESLAARYTMTFLGLHTFDRWGQNCTTGIFEKGGREFVFVPGDTVTLGWEQFAVGLNHLYCVSFFTSRQTALESSISISTIPILVGRTAPCGRIIIL